MIQISPQVDSSGSAGKTQDLRSEAPERTSLKKDKLGVFAKLLEGLIGSKGSDKRKSPLLKEENALTEGLEAEKSAGGEKAKGKNRKKIALFTGEEVQNNEAALTLLDSKGPTLGLARELTPERLLSAGQADDPAADMAEIVGEKIFGEDTAADAPGQNAALQKADRRSGKDSSELVPTGDQRPAEIPREAGAELLREKPLRTEGLTDNQDIPQEKPNSKDRFFRASQDPSPSDGRNAETGAFQLAGIKKTGVSGSDKEEAGKPSESKNSKRLRDSKDRDKINLQVRDLRSSGGAESAALAGTVETKRDVSVNGIHESELLVTLREGNQEPEDRSAAGNISAPGRAFEDMLARELHQNLNGDIVRHASIILKDGGEGSIKLSLRPESLGNVKIRLEMADNKITGHIVLESNEALRAFEREIRSLEQAFRDSGFESANLDMSLASDLWSADGGQNNGQREDGGMYPRPELVASRYETAAEILVPEARTSGVFDAASSREAVNMLV
ncbi:hypothetical protein AGMMS49928_15070 [Spirochaetia bacterium]|nr:hypothetical protein AGMMS49928_15070 [Spirochaetia bacterium]